MKSRLLLLVAAGSLGGCLSHPPPPPAPYHAIGIAKQWDLIIDDKNVTFIAPGGQPIVEPKPATVVGVAGDIYNTKRINVNIVHGHCAANGRDFPDRVQVYVDGVLNEGCGGL